MLQVRIPIQPLGFEWYYGVDGKTKIELVWLKWTKVITLTKIPTHPPHSNHNSIAKANMYYLHQYFLLWLFNGLPHPCQCLHSIYENPCTIRVFRPLILYYIFLLVTTGILLFYLPNSFLLYRPKLTPPFFFIDNQVRQLKFLDNVKTLCAVFISSVGQFRAPSSYPRLPWLEVPKPLQMSFYC